MDFITDPSAPPAGVVVGSQWRDRNATWLPKGHASIVTIEALWLLTDVGWSASVDRREVNHEGHTLTAHGRVAFDRESEDHGQGYIHAERLLAEFEPWTAPAGYVAPTWGGDL